MVLCECCDYNPAALFGYCTECRQSKCNLLDVRPNICPVLLKIGREPEYPLIMQLCEAEQVFLKPDTLYKFVVSTSCTRCNELKAMHNV